MEEKICSKCNALLWHEESKYGGINKKIEFKKENINILNLNFDTDVDSLTLEIILECKICNEKEELSLNGYTPYGALNASFD